MYFITICKKWAYRGNMCETKWGETYERLGEPADWDAAYTSYFKKDDDGNVVPNDDDTFVADTFFKKVTLIVGQTISVTIA